MLIVIVEGPMSKSNLNGSSISPGLKNYWVAIVEENGGKSFRLLVVKVFEL